MNSKNIIALLALSLAAFACGSDDDGGGPGPSGDAFEVTENIEADTTWTADNVYLLKNHIFVSGATLTIEPGTQILGLKGTSLVVTPSGQINAEGTEANPIVFTSGQPLGFRAPGDWGGLVLLGKATVNVPGGSTNIEGFPIDNETVFGGSDDAHNCGTVKYVRIEFAGFKLSEGNEINGLTLGGCGAATTLDFIQVHKGADDGIEFFGGSADLKHAVISQPDDDGLDGDLGWTGRVQFLIIQQNATVGNYGFEISNNEDAHDATPRTAPVIYNATLIGSDAEPGAAGKTQTPMRLKEGTAGTFRNLIVMHFADYSIDVTDASTVAQANGGNLLVENSFFFDNANDTDGGWPAAFEMNPEIPDDLFDEETFFTGATGNTFAENPTLSRPLDLASPAFAPTAEAPVQGGGVAPTGDGFFDVSATYAGAIGTDDWTAGWTAYPAN